ncbi:MAG: aminotransferase class V-fold PLP-dependent enzyme [Victivallaceae bacterium]|nr:aminotransferase class V-fold PLP-dependent enzyme [Victivallaceae bacterium]
MEAGLSIYFDNAAACRPDPKIWGYYYACASRFYANQEAAHALAVRERGQIAAAARRLSRALCGEETFVHWGHSGTGLFSLLGGFPGFQRGNIVTTALEHPALTAALKRTGAEIRFSSITAGRVDLEHLAGVLDEKTVLTAVYQVQSETGAIQDPVEIRRVLDARAPQSLLLTDTIQSAGKIPFSREKAQPDIISVSGPKIGAPAAAALLLNLSIPRARALADHLQRCRTEYYTAGRPEPAAVLALAQGIRKNLNELSENFNKVNAVNAFLRRELVKLKLINGKKPLLTIPADHASPYILHFIVPGYQSGVLVRMLSEANVYFSAGSACRSETDQPSAVLTAMNFSRGDAYAGIRLSFCPQNTLREAEIFLEKFQNALLTY